MKLQSMFPTKKILTQKFVFVSFLIFTYSFNVVGQVTNYASEQKVKDFIAAIIAIAGDNDSNFFEAQSKRIYNLTKPSTLVFLSSDNIVKMKDFLSLVKGDKNYKKTSSIIRISSKNTSGEIKVVTDQYIFSLAQLKIIRIESNSVLVEKLALIQKELIKEKYERLKAEDKLGEANAKIRSKDKELRSEKKMNQKLIKKNKKLQEESNSQKKEIKDTIRYYQELLRVSEQSRLENMLSAQKEKLVIKLLNILNDGYENLLPTSRKEPGGKHKKYKGIRGKKLLRNNKKLNAKIDSSNAINFAEKLRKILNENRIIFKGRYGTGIYTIAQLLKVLSKATKERPLIGIEKVGLVYSLDRRGYQIVKKPLPSIESMEEAYYRLEKLVIKVLKWEKVLKY